MICVQPSIVTTWKVVSTARAMLSNVLMPAFGPCFMFQLVNESETSYEGLDLHVLLTDHFSRQMDVLASQR